MASASGTSLPLLSLPSRAEMERAYQGSDASYDGVFYLGVRTTGIFCRPSCPARKPKPENVEFFALPKEALFAGYRPCLRCRPLDGDEAPAWVRPLLERIEQHPQARVRESDLRAMGIEPARVRRYFMTKFGLTFQAYCRARRLARAFEGIKDGTSLDDAVFETGYDSHSGFREAFEKAFGEPPGRAAEADCIRLAWIDTPIGPMVAGAKDTGLCLLEFTDRRRLELQIATLRKRFKAALVPSDHPYLTQVRTELAEYFAGTRAVIHGAARRARHAVRGARLAGAQSHSTRRDAIVRGHRARSRHARRRSRRRPRQRHESDRDRDPLPSRAQQER